MRYLLSASISPLYDDKTEALVTSFTIARYYQPSLAVMRKYLLFILLAYSIPQKSTAQNIGINATGALPHPSAMLDVSAANKGILIPRTSSGSRTAIANPAKGLMLYDTTTSSFWYHNGNAWAELAAGGTGTGSSPWSQNGTNIFNSNTGNVGIGINAPLAPLHIKNDSEAVRISGNTSYISFHDSTGARKGFLQSYKNDLYLGTPSTNTTGIMQFYLKNIPVMTVLPSGNTGIGTVTPIDKLTVQTAGYGLTHTDGNATIGTWIGNFQGVTTAKIGTKSNHALGLFANNGDPALYISTNGKVGIGTMFPVKPLHVLTPSNSYGMAQQSTDGALLATYIGGTSAGIGTFTNTNMRIFCNSGSAVFIESGTNNVGLGVDFPANKLQIGSVGNTGFATNDFAIGNGTSAMAIYQTDASTLIGATTDIILKPRNNGKGRVGINTETPRASLDVDDNVAIPNGYYAYMNGTADLDGIELCKFCTPQVSIMASYGVYAAEFDAFSDARIKNIEGLSNGAKDLEAVNALRITNYKMKDRVKYADKSFKKVIAQEVEKVYPQAVSRHTDFIPNVYQATSELIKTDDGYLLRFPGQHHISSDAKKLRVLVEDKGMQVFDIISVSSGSEVIIKAADIKSDRLFVYGEEVNDFRTVDYEALTTLSISATQEISRLLKKQTVTIVIQQQQLALLQKRLAALEGNHTKPFFHKTD